MTPGRKSAARSWDRRLESFCFCFLLSLSLALVLPLFSLFVPPPSSAFESRRKEKHRNLGVLVSLSLSLFFSFPSFHRSPHSVHPTNDTRVLPPSPPLVEADVDAVLAGVADLTRGNVSATRFCSRPCARRYLNARQGSVSRAIKAMRYVSCSSRWCEKWRSRYQQQQRETKRRETEKKNIIIEISLVAPPRSRPKGETKKTSPSFSSVSFSLSPPFSNSIQPKTAPPSPGARSTSPTRSPLTTSRPSTRGGSSSRKTATSMAGRWCFSGCGEGFFLRLLFFSTFCRSNRSPRSIPGPLLEPIGGGEKDGNLKNGLWRVSLFLFLIDSTPSLTSLFSFYYQLSLHLTTAARLPRTPPRPRSSATGSTWSSASPRSGTTTVREERG